MYNNVYVNYIARTKISSTKRHFQARNRTQRTEIFTLSLHSDKFAFDSQLDENLSLNK